MEIEKIPARSWSRTPEMKNNAELDAVPGADCSGGCHITLVRIGF
jgi:hypothetical protein